MRINTEIYNNIELLPENTIGWHGSARLFGELIDEISPKLIIEVGSWLGLSAINMGIHCKSSGFDTKIYCVDTWLGNYEWHISDDPKVNMKLKNGYPQVYYQFLSNVVHNDLQDIITPFPSTSSMMSKYFKENNIESELIYIDASHEYGDVLRDLECYYTLLKEGGVIFGDDYGWDGVKEAVKIFSNNIEKEIFVHDNNFWVIRK